MSDQKPENNTNPENQPSNNQDWREQRRQWRDERRERRHQDPLRGLFWGLILILIGVLFFANQQGWIPPDRWWQFLLIGLGVIFIINGLAHFWSSTYRHSSYGQFIPGVVLLFVGIAFLYNFSQWWPIVLIGVGVAILLSLLFRRS